MTVHRRTDGGRRRAIRLTLALLVVAGLRQALVGRAAPRAGEPGIDLERAGVPALQAAMADGSVTSEQLVTGYLARIAAISSGGPSVNAIRSLNPHAVDDARTLDRERQAGRVRGPLHGIPVLVKDNIDMAGLPTTAGSLALERSVPASDAFVTARLRAAGAVLLGKTNLTEFANFMTGGMPSGYSSLGGQVLNPYDASITPSGSSAGSGVAAAVGLAAVTVGTETSGSILSPSVANSLVGVKPTIGLVSRTGILPISSTQDTAGPMARTVTDAAILLGALAGRDDADPVTLQGPAEPVDYAAALSTTALQGARIGVVGNTPTGGTGVVLEAALAVLRAQGAEVVTATLTSGSLPPDVLTEEFERDLNAYLARLPSDAPMRTLADIVAFNLDHAADGTMKFGQTQLVASEAVDLADPATSSAYEAARTAALTASRSRIDAALAGGGLGALLFVSAGSAYIGAMAGYPSVAVPIGYNPTNGRPVGITLLAGPYAEARLLGYAYDFEQAAAVWRPPAVMNPSLFRNVRIEAPVDGASYLPALKVRN